MRKLILSVCLLSLTVTGFSKTILVKNIQELNEASKKVVPGDIIVLKNGEWKDVVLKLQAIGTKQQPITYKAQTAGKVFITGNSRLALGGEWQVVDGLFFKNGFAGDRAVIEFRADKDNLANHCRVTNCAIDDFNNAKRLDENNWVLFYGKNNQLDHCSFKDKKNLGVLLAVILDDDRSRENFHSIDHNYFGRRPPLASNGGEIIRVGVSQHCQFNSNTQIIDNKFENCDGETEIISIKSGSNLVKRNLFRECQGGVVLRHGDNNTVEDNIFLGNNKPGTGGVRVINKGQWVVNNFFYRCRGVDFRSPLSIMNGIPNSPANRYVQVTDAVIANNTFMECSPISFCEGSDAERTLPPANVLFLNNLFYNTVDSTVYNVFDDISGIQFIGNEINNNSKLTGRGKIDDKFIKAIQKIETYGHYTLPLTQVKGAVALPDSISKLSFKRLGHSLSTKPGFDGMGLIKMVELNAIKNTGNRWYTRKEQQPRIWPKEFICGSTAEIYKILDQKIPASIILTSDRYELDKPFIISSLVKFSSEKMVNIKFVTGKLSSVFIIMGNGELQLGKLVLDGSEVKAKHFISNDETGPSAHFNFLAHDVMISGLDRKNGCEHFFFGYKSSVADWIYITQVIFQNNKVDLVVMEDEKDDKGYYNAEIIGIQKNSFQNHEGIICSVYRGGNDESTMGPTLNFFENNLADCNSPGRPLFSFTGVQVSALYNNNFKNCNPGGVLVKYQDKVRARHRFEKNKLSNSGKLETNQFVTTDLSNN